MALIKKSALSEFTSIKKDIEKGYNYFQNNYKMYNDFIRFVFKSSITPAAAAANKELDIPSLEFNILEAYISRLCGEFSKMDPAFSIRAKEGVKLIDPRVIEVVEAHTKAAFIGGDKRSLSYHLYRDLLSGGYSVAKIYTDYADEMAFDQKIFVERVFDPTLTVFDPLARKSHKGDGRFCCELFPKTEDEAVEMYGSDILKDVSFTRGSDVAQFNWSYMNQQENIILFGEYFKKKIKRTKILKLANGHSVTEKSYEDFMERWNKAGIMEQAPIVLKSRMTDIETIDKYTVTGGKIVDHKETNFSMLPLVFFDGNSVIVRDDMNAQSQQVVRPYIYQARDTQKMKNYAGQSLCNELENVVQHKWTAPVEGIPDNKDYQLAYINPQKAQVVLYNQFKDGDPNQPLNPPREIVRTPIPPEISNTFQMADNTVQVILGSYDAAQGNLDGDLSGIAIMQGAMHSNSSAMPYTMGFIEGWGRCGEIYLNLLPKYFVTPRTIPVVHPNGKRDFYEINKGDNVKFDYDVSALELTIEPGVNFAVQKQIALKTIEHLMSVSESFKAFMDQNGLEVLLENIDIRGIEKLRYLSAQWMEQQKQKAQAAEQAQQNAMTPDKLLEEQVNIEKMRVMSEAESSKRKSEIELTKITADNAVKNKEADIKFLEVMSKVQGEDLDRALQQEKIDAEQSRTAVDMAINLSSHMNKMNKGEMKSASEEVSE